MFSTRYRVTLGVVHGEHSVALKWVSVLLRRETQPSNQIDSYSHIFVCEFAYLYSIREFLAGNHRLFTAASTTKTPASISDMTTGRLQGKVCVITGSSSGLGRAISLGYAQQGALLVCADLRPTARQEVPSEATVPTDELVRQKGGNAIFIRTDVSKAEDWQALVEQAVETYGRIDV